MTNALGQEADRFISIHKFLEALVDRAKHLDS